VSREGAGAGPAAGVSTVRAPLAPEDQARADVYALLSRLFSAAPDAALLRALGEAPRLPLDIGAGWPAAFNRLADASTVVDAATAEQEYTDLFIGVGRSEVDLHASHWIEQPMIERPLALLRGELAAMGIGRRAGATLLEDHLGPLLETMRFLISGMDGAAPADMAVQRAFFERWLDGWVDRCCGAIETHSIANYYRRVGQCTKVFLALERDSFAME
jgi:TorA maturation chaperone TorD